MGAIQEAVGLGLGEEAGVGTQAGQLVPPLDLGGSLSLPGAGQDCGGPPWAQPGEEEVSSLAPKPSFSCCSSRRERPKASEF